MAKKQRRKSKKPEMLSCDVTISSIRPRVSFTMRDANGPDPEVNSHCGLELRGTMDIRFAMCTKRSSTFGPTWTTELAPNRPAYVGYITHTRPEVAVIASCRSVDFEYLWSLALSAQLKHAFITFTRPHYGSASVSYMSFSNELEE
jgi:hypothetical protein